jgi:four helix bundle protein
MMHNFENLQFWKRSMILTKKVYLLCLKIDINEKFGLISQMKRSAVSILSNIAEGSGRNSNKEFNHFLAIALGSSFELQTQLILTRDLEILEANDVGNLISELKEIQRMIFAFKKKLDK